MVTANLIRLKGCI